MLLLLLRCHPTFTRWSIISPALTHFIHYIPHVVIVPTHLLFPILYWALRSFPFVYVTFPVVYSFRSVSFTFPVLFCWCLFPISYRLRCFIVVVVPHPTSFVVVTFCTLPHFYYHSLFICLHSIYVTSVVVYSFPHSLIERNVVPPVLLYLFIYIYFFCGVTAFTHIQISLPLYIPHHHLSSTTHTYTYTLFTHIYLPLIPPFSILSGRCCILFCDFTIYTCHTLHFTFVVVILLLLFILPLHPHLLLCPILLVGGWNIPSLPYIYFIALVSCWLLIFLPIVSVVVDDVVHLLVFDPSHSHSPFFCDIVLPLLFVGDLQTVGRRYKFIYHCVLYCYLFIAYIYLPLTTLPCPLHLFGKCSTLLSYFVLSPLYYPLRWWQVSGGEASRWGISPHIADIHIPHPHLLLVEAVIVVVVVDAFWFTFIYLTHFYTALPHAHFHTCNFTVRLLPFTHTPRYVAIVRTYILFAFRIRCLHTYCVTAIFLFRHLFVLLPHDPVVYIFLHSLHFGRFIYPFYVTLRCWFPHFPDVSFPFPFRLRCSSTYVPLYVAILSSSRCWFYVGCVLVSWYIWLDFDFPVLPILFTFVVTHFTHLTLHFVHTRHAFCTFLCPSHVPHIYPLERCAASLLCPSYIPCPITPFTLLLCLSGGEWWWWCLGTSPHGHSPLVTTHTCSPDRSSTPPLPSFDDVVAPSDPLPLHCIVCGWWRAVDPSIHLHCIVYIVLLWVMRCWRRNVNIVIWPPVVTLIYSHSLLLCLIVFDIIPIGVYLTFLGGDGGAWVTLPTLSQLRLHCSIVDPSFDLIGGSFDRYSWTFITHSIWPPDLSTFIYHFIYPLLLLLFIIVPLTLHSPTHFVDPIIYICYLLFIQTFIPLHYCCYLFVVVTLSLSCCWYSIYIVIHCLFIPVCWCWFLIDRRTFGELSEQVGIVYIPLFPTFLLTPRSITFSVDAVITFTWPPLPPHIPICCTSGVLFALYPSFEPVDIPHIACCPLSLLVTCWWWAGSSGGGAHIWPLI